MGLKICTKNAWRVDVMGAYMDIYLAGIFIMKPKGVHYSTTGTSCCLVEVVGGGRKGKREFPMVCITSHDRGSLYKRLGGHTRGRSAPSPLFPERK